jgi:high-affinity nickel-transport protein
MQQVLCGMLTDGAGRVRSRIVSMYIVLIASNLLVWVWALTAFRDRPVLLGTALLAYTFGLRHAVDADHIAAIDNVTRKLMQEGKRPVAVGFFFSIGHASVVIAMSAAVAVAAAALQSRFAAFKAVGAVISTAASALFLFAIAAANTVILAAIYRRFRAAKRGAPADEADLDMLLADRGLLARLFRPLFRMVGRSWHLLPIGVLFGLGFDTATEVALFGIAASEVSKGLGVWSTMVFPALFAAAMSLIDTTDGILMLGAYGWAFMKPLRKLYYNLTITALSVVVAVAIGGIETLGLIGGRLDLQGPFWHMIGALNDNFGLLGYGIIGIFVAGWGLSIVIYRLGRYDGLDARP